MNELQDSHGRRFKYLRLSVTDICNFRCSYCLPNGYQINPKQNDGELNTGEIHNLVTAVAALGVTKVRLTGGEPTLRQDLAEIASGIAAVPGIRKLALSTNGHSLKRNAAAYRRAGISAVNISLDSLKEGSFREITGSNRHKEILEGVDAALDAGFDIVKTNAVLMRGLNDGELPMFLDWAKNRPISFRFIELMQTGAIGEMFMQRHIRANFIHSTLIRSGWVPNPRQIDDGPALEYSHKDYKGRIGIIAPYSEHFCQTCNRLRVSSRGRLQLCLFGAGDLSLRPWLASEEQCRDLQRVICESLTSKLPRHRLHEADAGQTENLSMIGG